MSALPDAFLDRLRTVVPPEELAETLASFESPPATGFRVNTLRADAANVLASLEAEGVEAQAVEGIPDGYWVPATERASLLASTAYAEDRIYVQNLSSQIPALALDPQPGERVLDLCAAPGSKTRHLACLMRDEGEIAAVEAVRGRFFKLRANLEAQGTTIVRTFHRDGATVWRHRPEHFDRVLVDAPCSTEGRFRTDEPETFAYWSERKVKEMARKQKKLLFSAIQSLQPGGTLVYSTCTFAPEENEVVLERMLRKFDGSVEAVPVTLPPNARVQPALATWNGKALARTREARRLLPTETMEAFFIAKLVKHESTLPERR